jgi:hypothetical protein
VAEGPTPLGAHMGSSVFFFPPSHNKYCHNGGMALAHCSAAATRHVKVPAVAMAGKGAPRRSLDA